MMKIPRPRRFLAVTAACIALITGAVLAQRADRVAGYENEPGGVAEAQHWQVLALMGTGEKEPANWDGSLRVEGGELFEVTGYRFEQPDRVLPQGGWRMRTRRETILFGQGGERPQQAVLPKGLLLRGSGSPRITLATAHGECRVDPSTLAIGAVQRCAGNRMEIRRVPAATDLSGTELRQHDFPTMAGGRDGVLWAAWSSYHDQREELNFRRYAGGRWTRLIPVARASADLMRPQTAVDAAGTPWLVWAQQEQGNWDIWAMPWLEKGSEFTWGERVRLSDNPLPDIEPHVATGPDGTIFVVWQAMVGRYSQIHLRSLQAGRWSAVQKVTEGAFNNWDPAIAAAPDGSAWIAWDRYRTSYDIFCRRLTAGGVLEPERVVAQSGRFEAYATIAVDARSRPWIAWESGGVAWGKDLGPLSPRQPGSPLGESRSIEVAVLDQGEWKTPPPLAPSDALQAGSNGFGNPLLYVDPQGSVWLAFKRRYSRRGQSGMTHWEAFVSRLTEGGWSDPLLLANSTSRKSTRMSVTAAEGRVWFFWPTDSRRYEFASRPRGGRVIAGSLPLPPQGGMPPLQRYTAPADAAAGGAGHADEAGDVKTIQSHRVRVGKEDLQIVRGDLHRHTELSQDQGGLSDGSLPEFYRYMIDAAEMDFGASTDHQAGGIDYWAFHTLKMADMYHFPERFVTLYGYERNLGFPHGHRNILHTRRGYPIVPFFQRPDPRFQLPDAPDGELLTFNSNSYGGAVENDTKLLFEELRKSGGLAIPHTSGSTGMGTDWRDNNRELEPLVEIYQGDRHNYEHKNAPRGVRDGEEKKAIAGFQEAGMVWNAWKKGYRLGVIASSDHFSTHISYAMVYTPKRERDAIFEAIKKRHAYGATDNIVLEFWLGNGFMGDEIRLSRREKLRVKVRGTAAVENVHLIRDGIYLHKAQPRTREVSMEFMDTAAGAGEHWYYVRVEQSDGELAWSSPIWVTYTR